MIDSVLRARLMNTPPMNCQKCFQPVYLDHLEERGEMVVLCYKNGGYEQDLKGMLISNSVLSHAEQIAARTGSNICIDGIVYVVTEDLLYQYLVLKEIPR